MALKPAPYSEQTQRVTPVRPPSSRHSSNERPSKQRSRRPAPRRSAAPPTSPLALTQPINAVSQVTVIPPAPPIPRPQRPWLPSRQRLNQRSGLNWSLLAAVILTPLVIVLVIGLTLTVGALALVGNGKILPGVRAAGIGLGGQSASEAVAALQTTWQGRGIVLKEGDVGREFPIQPEALGVTMDAQATALAALDYGRSNGGIVAAVQAIIGHVDVPPVVIVDPNVAAAALQNLAPQVERPVVNAGVQVVNGQAQATPSVEGQALDVDATVAELAQDTRRALADGTLNLVMVSVPPAVTDSSAMVAAAGALLTHSLQIQAYDPISDQSQDWTLPPNQWIGWLLTQPDPTSPVGLSLMTSDSQVRSDLTNLANSLPADEYVNLDEAVSAVSQAVSAGNTDIWTRIYHHPTQHVVQPGETIISIAYAVGMPYPWIQAANPGVGDVSAGQTITIPSPDEQLPVPVVPNKRIVVNISQQHAWIYENGAVKWDWVISTGIDSSPTWPGVYQIQEHVPNAYAANWNLWMPDFLGVYRPIPGYNFMNGFHGFPTRGGSQLLWTNDLGTRVTYGCILLSTENAQTLYNWAEDGVVVEIQP